MMPAPVLLKGASRLETAKNATETTRSLDPDWRNRPVVKELSTKLAWAIGSTLHITYKENSQTHKWAEELALRVYQAYKKALGSTA